MTHISVTYSVEGNCEINTWYAATAEQEQEWKSWVGRQTASPSDEAVEAWLEANGITMLDRTGGPAVVMSFSDGSRVEEWWVSNNLHRVEGPAILEVNAEGIINREEWYRNGLLDRAGGPAVVVRAPNGSVVLEEWYHHGESDRTRGRWRGNTGPGATP